MFDIRYTHAFFTHSSCFPNNPNDESDQTSLIEVNTRPVANQPAYGVRSPLIPNTMADAEPNKKKSSFPFKHLTPLRKPTARSPSIVANGPNRDGYADDGDSLSFFQQSRPQVLPAPLPAVKRRLKKGRQGDLSPERVSAERKRRKISLEHHSDGDSVTDASASASEADDQLHR